MKFKELKELQERLYKQLEDIKNETVSAVADAKPLDGVKSYGSFSTVRLSTIANNNMILTPEYYMSETGAELIKKKLENIKTIDQFEKTINEIVKKKCVTIGNHHYPINNNIIKCLETILE